MRADRTTLGLAAILTVGGATIAGALVSQHVFGLVPCKLCLEQRQPYYLGLPIAVLLLLAPRRRPWFALGLLMLALVFAAGSALGVYHAGAEWGFWPGPSDCGGGSRAPASAGDLLQSLQSIRVVSCTEAAWRFLGISLAGWNALIAGALALGAGALALRHARQGSSSVSQ